MDDTADEWQPVKAAWAEANQLGYKAVMQAAKVGQMLIDLKGKTKTGKFQEEVHHAALPFEYRTAADLMKLAQYVPLLEQHQPESQRAALKLISETRPKKPAAPKATKVVLRLTQSEFDLLRECLQADGVPDEMQDRFKQALEIIDRPKT